MSDSAYADMANIETWANAQRKDLCFYINYQEQIKTRDGCELLSNKSLTAALSGIHLGACAKEEA